MNNDARKFAPAAARNRAAILDVLGRRLPSRGQLLEIASGSGEHTMHFAAAHPDLTFQPSDPDPTNRASIDAWAAHLGLRQAFREFRTGVEHSVVGNARHGHDHR